MDVEKIIKKLTHKKPTRIKEFFTKTNGVHIKMENGLCLEGTLAGQNTGPR
jgi:hypothetical protein